MFFQVLVLNRSQGKTQYYTIRVKFLIRDQCTKRKQPSRGVLKKRCSENMQQIFRRTPMSKCDFNKVAKQLY